MIKNTTRNQKIGWILSVLYLLALTYFMFFAEEYGRGPFSRETYAYNLKPFREILRFWIYRDQIGLKGVFLNLVGNVAAFFPCGFFLPIISGRCKRYWYNTIICGFLVSLFIETTQLVFRMGSFDVDDIILNTSGTVIGYLIYRMVQRIRIEWRRHSRKEKSV